MRYLRNHNRELLLTSEKRVVAVSTASSLVPE